MKDAQSGFLGSHPPLQVAYRAARDKKLSWPLLLGAQISTPRAVRIDADPWETWWLRLARGACAFFIPSDLLSIHIQTNESPHFPARDEIHCAPSNALQHQRIRPCAFCLCRRTPGEVTRRTNTGKQRVSSTNCSSAGDLNLFCR